jgi:hypothetical protein
LSWQVQNIKQTADSPGDSGFFVLYCPAKPASIQCFWGLLPQLQPLKPRAKPYKLTDGAGLFVEVTPSGSKLWRLKYRRTNGQGKQTPSREVWRRRDCEERRCAGRSRRRRSCSDSCNEVVLLADVLGLSTLVKTISNSNTPDSTGGALLGPFYRANSPKFSSGDSIAQGGTPGMPLYVNLRVLNTRNETVPNAMIEVW